MTEKSENRKLGQVEGTHLTEKSENQKLGQIEGTHLTEKMKIGNRVKKEYRILGHESG
ncbi:hypothetical protein [Neobacillus niacini]|uniref:hypothetical protein n=1 Tax=Neobacillus niacini TaxID=86668 RepID=UPI000AB906CA|nr:hypothetical protein [Neobacillus niacini]